MANFILGPLDNSSPLSQSQNLTGSDTDISSTTTLSSATTTIHRRVNSGPPSAPSLSSSSCSEAPSIHLSKKRHYKKDSRYLLDLYTLTFDENQTVDEIETCKTTIITNEDHQEFVSLAPSFSDSGGSGNDKYNGPASLQINNNVLLPKNQVETVLPSLETNLHKILARKIRDSEDVDFRKTKLLTKAYYKLLRDTSITTTIVSNRRRKTKMKDEEESIPRLDWQRLLDTNVNELERIVNGLSNSFKALNDYLMDILIERDELIAQQDQMLEKLSELTDNLL